MSTPVIKEPTKKKFHFPKNAKRPVTKTETQPSKPRKTVSSKETAPQGASEAHQSKKAQAAPAPATTERKAQRVKKEKVVRDSFTMPKSDYAKIDELKKRCVAAGVSVKKSELLRAGLQMLAFAPQKRLVDAVCAVERVKTGRPAKS
jgi:hypothetical protein